MSEVIQQLNEKNSDFIPMKENEPTKIVLLSLGCGTIGDTKGIDANTAKSIPAKDWTSIALLGLTSAPGDMNQYHLASIFPDHPSSNNYYLRIEVHYLHLVRLWDLE